MRSNVQCKNVKVQSENGDLAGVVGLQVLDRRAASSEGMLEFVLEHKKLRDQ